MTDKEEMPWENCQCIACAMAAGDNSHLLKPSIRNTSCKQCGGTGLCKNIPESEARELWEGNETLRMKLAACGVIAGCNTKESQETQGIGKDSPYYSASYQDVLDCVNREMKLIKENARLREALEFYSDSTANPLCKNTFKHDDGKKARQALNNE